MKRIGYKARVLVVNDALVDVSYGLHALIDAVERSALQKV